MPLHLHQLIAIAGSKRKAAEDTKTQVYHRIQNPDAFNGMSRRYNPYQDATSDNEVERLPPEDKFAVTTVKAELARFQAAMVELLDTVAAMDKGNTQAKTDIVVDGKTLAKEVPVTTLLFLEKQLVDFSTFLSKLPVVDPAEQWSYDDASGMLRTDAKTTVRTKKVQKVVVLAPATEKHPAQVQLVPDDVAVGAWQTIKNSGALTATQKQKLVDRARQLLEAVQMARETANMQTVEKVNLGAQLYGYICDGLTGSP